MCFMWGVTKLFCSQCVEHLRLKNKSIDFIYRFISCPKITTEGYSTEKIMFNRVLVSLASEVRGLFFHTNRKIILKTVKSEQFGLAITSKNLINL